MSHPLGLVFYTGVLACRRTTRGGAFVGEHGSWDRDPLNGYRSSTIPLREWSTERHGRGRSDPAS